MATTCELIAKNVLGSDTASVTFSSIPGTYTDLYVVISARTDRAFPTDVVRVEFNASGGTTNQSGRDLYAGGTNDSLFSITQTQVRFGTATGDSGTADTFGTSETYIANYAGSANKSISMAGVAENNASTANSAFIFISAGLWSDTSAITEMKFVPGTGTNFLTGSSFYLYGITKA